MGEIYIDNSIVNSSKPLHAKVLPYLSEPGKQKQYSVISAHEDNSVMASYYLWDNLEINKELYTHESNVNALAVSHTPENKQTRIVTASIDGQIQFAQLYLSDTFHWSEQTLQPPTKNQNRANTFFLFLQQNGMFISGHQNGDIKLWGTDKITLEQHEKASLNVTNKSIIDLQYWKIENRDEFIFVTTDDNRCHLITIKVDAEGLPTLIDNQTPLSFCLTATSSKSSWCNIAIHNGLIAYVDKAHKLRLGTIEIGKLSHVPIIMHNTEQPLDIRGKALLDITTNTHFHIKFINTDQGLLLVLWSSCSARFVVLKINERSATVLHADELQPGNIFDGSIICIPQMIAFTLHSNGLIKQRTINLGVAQPHSVSINGSLAEIRATFLNCDGTIMMALPYSNNVNHWSFSLYSTETGKPIGTISSIEGFAFILFAFHATDPKKIFAVSRKFSNGSSLQGVNLIQMIDISTGHIVGTECLGFVPKQITINPDGNQLALICFTKLYLVNINDFSHTIVECASPIDEIYYNATGTQFMLRFIHSDSNFSLTLFPRDAHSRIQIYPCPNQELNNLLGQRQAHTIRNLHMSFINDGQFIILSDVVRGGIHFYQTNTPANAIAAGWKSYEQRVFFNLDAQVADEHHAMIHLFTIDPKLNNFYIIWKTSQTDFLIRYKHTRETSIPLLGHTEHNSKIMPLSPPLDPATGEEITDIKMCKEGIICQTVDNIHVGVNNKWKTHQQMHLSAVHPTTQLMLTSLAFHPNHIFKFTPRTLQSLQVLLLLIMGQRRLTHGRRLPRIPPELLHLLTDAYLL